MKRTWLIDSGHGGMIDGEYVTAPDKMFTHSNNEVFYEGVYNRDIKDMLFRRLWDAGIHCIDICPSELDIPLYERVSVANTYHTHYQNCVILSLHSNASPQHNASGFEVFAYNSTKSRRYGNILGEQLVYDFELPFRKADDNNFVKYGDLYLLKYTICPAILVECLFFDNYQDYQLLIDPEFKKRYVNSLIQFILKAELVSV